VQLFLLFFVDTVVGWGRGTSPLPGLDILRNQESPTMYDEDEEIDPTEPDDLEEKTALEFRQAEKFWRKFIAWSAGIGLAVYGVAKLSNWLFGFPANIKGIDETIFWMFLLFAGIALISVVTSCIDSTMREFRIRSRQMSQRLSKIEARIDSIKRSESSKVMEG
jgi:hypothetical protein